MTARRSRKRGVTLAELRRIALALPGTEEGTSYGTPAFRVRRKLIARIHDSGELLVLRMPLEEREVLLAADPKTFTVTDHYRGHPWILVRLAAVRAADLAQLLEQAWRDVASDREIAALGRGGAG